MDEASATRFERAIAAIDAANAEDPHRIELGGELRPKERAHAELVTGWVERLSARPGEALLLAARAHHLRRWTLPRSEFPQGRAGYHRWRGELQRRHAEETSAILRESGYDDATVSRVSALICKRGLGEDPEVQVLEDALCLVFVGTQLREFASRHPDEKVVDVLVKSLRKMSPAGRVALGEIAVGGVEKGLIAQALDALGEG